ncbi:aerobic-type carbon monoxide dehydrogenase small subunit CoxS/CutS-like protein [Oleiphilus messinensis]|uniref:Aerobic-type carbon monoxide dehydrogenase small subunit CoxS/CutS-like protein n=1 Tax=Oleiphilus messinensis TaxID=141451 RepID=A0A1Y0I6I0_9GAMM|nr:(2Fe-2S)-binding protein [Oleiphilus messinensis]ARU55145.1 aerobic-type carbon monoxide dehydrogenase small subunit CoxS/CutS-like protein [Oleiphilus messinensis]
MKITINGQERDLQGLDEQTPLLWVVRDELNLKGTKFGCGMGLCGACTVHLNGEAIRSCITPVGAVKGQEITTIEGIGSEENPHPLQVAWQQFNVPQCGYCQSGQLMSAHALLQRNANPNDAEIVSAMSGNICRCGTYPRIKKAIKSVAKTGDSMVQEVQP